MPEYSKGYGTTIGYSEVGGNLYSKIARVTEIKPPKVSVDAIDTTHLTSPEQWKEKVAGWKDTGDAEVTCQFEKSSIGDIYELLALDKSWEIEFSDGSTLTFDGFLAGIEPAIERDGLITATLTITVSGKVDLTPAV